MTFSIDISYKAKKQIEILKLIPAPCCTLQNNGKNYKATINCIYVAGKKVDDAYRYIIEITKSGVSITDFLNLSTGRGYFKDKFLSNSNNQKIVLVIESPHVHEYDHKQNPIAPAQKTTGINIHTHIKTIFNQKNNFNLPDGIYDFIICNPVQFQASLHHLHKLPLSGKNNKGGATATLRNKAWQAIYALEKKDFYARLNSYSPKIIINACTAKLKPFVTTELNKWNATSKIKSRIFIANNHPCQWYKLPVIKP